MKTTKKIGRGLGLVTLSIVLAAAFVLIFSGCASSSSATGTAEAKAGAQTKTEEKAVEAKVTDQGSPAWTVEVNGVRSDSFDQDYFNEAKTHESHYVTWKLEKKGTVYTYQGMPLRLIVAMADGNDGSHPYTFDAALWKKGYDVTLTGNDGYSATFSTLEIGPEDLMVADTEDGKPIPPSIVGDVSGKLWVKDLATIDLGLMQKVSEEEPFELIVDVNNSVQSFTLKELEESPYYIEDKGSFTTSAGTTSTYLYGGVKFADFLRQYMMLEKDNTITMVAMDGYEMTYSGEQILDESDGVWILAFKRDGEYMPKDPGYIRTVKVGPGVPNIDGHLSVRMIAKVVASGESYKTFTLAMKGKMDRDIDRQTFQSCTSCHSTTITYKDRKSGEEFPYTGVPLWLLCANSDDESYAPHGQDKSIISYNEKIALAGYQVKITAADGFSVTLNSKEVNKNRDVIIAMYKNGEVLPENEWPLIMVWDKDAKLVPNGIKNVRSVGKIELLF